LQLEKVRVKVPLKEVQMEGKAKLSQRRKVVRTMKAKGDHLKRAIPIQ